MLAWRRYSHNFEGGYLHTTDGKFIATDARRIVLLDGVEKSEKDVIIDHEGDEWESPIQKLLSLVSDAIGDYEYEKQKE